MQTPAKEVFISYAPEDKQIAFELKKSIQDLFGVTTWIHDFNLNGGDLVSDAIDRAISDAKWWIVLLSKAATNSSWITREATLGTFKSINNENFKVILIKIEECNYPRDLEIISRSQVTIDLSREKNKTEGFNQIASYIEKFDKTRTSLRVYEGRGSDRDKFSLVARKNKVIFMLGWRGIGKTAFVENSVQEFFKKKPLKITLTYNHSLDRLARDILSVTHSKQPLGDPSDKELLEYSIEALAKLSENFFLFLDDAENGLDGSNRLFSFLETFLKEVKKKNIDTHIVIATTRTPDYSNELASDADVFRLGIIEDSYIEEIIYLWLEGSENKELFQRRNSDREKIIKVVGGHPLAAKRMASYLKLKSIEQLIEATRAERFQLGFADYILRATQETLDDLHLLILKTLAIIQEPIEQHELSKVRAISEKYDEENIQKALWELSDWFLIEQKGEKIYLHSFLRAYYSNQLAKEIELRNKISEDFGMYAFNRAIELESHIKDAINMPNSTELLAKLSNDLYRYALPADRLLRVVGKDEIANKLSLRSTGTLKGMAYYFYQEAADYTKALEYAQKWLSINPTDWDVKLYQIRSYRKLGGKTNLEKAWSLIQELSQGNHKKQFQVRIIREKARLSIIEGDVDAGEGYYRQAIKLDSDSIQPYSEIYAGLARLLIKKADDSPEWEPQHQSFALEALNLLETAKKEPDNFYRFHIDAYAEALSQLDQYELAYPLLLESLTFRPDDGKLNFRMAEIQRRKKNFSEAKRYAEISIKNGYNSSFLTYANILYDEALETTGKISRQEFEKLLNLALEKIALYLKLDNSANHENEVAHTISAKIYRTLGNPDKAAKEISNYKNSNNPYTVYEQANLCLIRGNLSDNLPDALGKIQEGIDIIQRYKYKLSNPLTVLESTLQERKKLLRRQLNLE